MEPNRPLGSLIDRQALARMEPQTVECFVASTIDRVYSLLYRMLGHRQDAEDLAQETYAKAFKALPAYRGESSAETWLYRVALNVGRDAIARRQADRKRLDDEFDADTLPSSSRRGSDPAAELVETEEAEMLHESLKALSDDRREIIMLADVEGLSTDEIAHVLELPAGTVKSRLHRAREALREEVRNRSGKRDAGCGMVPPPGARPVSPAPWVPPSSGRKGLS